MPAARSTKTGSAPDARMVSGRPVVAEMEIMQRPFTSGNSPQVCSLYPASSIN